jgi:5'-nucleotidase
MKTCSGASLLLITATLLLVSGCIPEPDNRMVTLLATNDIHGGIEPAKGPKANDSLGAMNLVGGLAFFSGAVKSIKQGLAQQYGDKAGVLVLDGGDQFQGTLISNYTEGSLIFGAMNDVGYDAAITGNHDYDFGPHGWLVDDVKDVDPNDPSADRDPRGVIKDLISHANFPIVSANTYFKSSMLDKNGKSVDVAGEGCAPSISGTDIDWANAKRPDFLKPYFIKNVAGVRVAVIGIDTPETPTTTTPDNVSDLCFRNEFDSYKEIRSQLGSQADVFVLLIHDGDTDNSSDVSTLADKLYKDSADNVDVIISAHTHYTYNKSVDGIPVIQSGHGGDAFGRVDLVYDVAAHALDRSKTAALAGIKMDYAACAPSSQSFCQVLDNPKGVSYDGVPVVVDQDIVSKIAAVRRNIAPMATRVMGTAAVKMTVNRIAESSVADALTDAFRVASSADISFMNTGGLRTDLEAGPITYEDLFKVIPFNNHGYVVGPMAAGKLLSLLTRSIQTCGQYGALMQSGLKVTFIRNCASNSDIDKSAELVHIETLSGEVILDVPNGIFPKDTRVFNVATLDFLAEGGSGYTDFIGTPRINDMGVLREVLANNLAKSPAQWSGAVDGRWKALTSMPAPAPIASPPPSSSPAPQPASPAPKPPLPVPVSAPAQGPAPGPATTKPANAPSSPSSH